MTILNGYSNWMQASDGLLDKTLSEIVMPGVHHYDSCGLGKTVSACAAKGIKAAAVGTSMFPLVKDLFLEYVRAHAITQHSSVSSLLNMGARYLDSRNCYDPETGEWRTYHQVYGANSRAGLKAIKHFLTENPQELIMIEVNYSGPDEPTAHHPGNQGLIGLLEEELGGLLFKRPDQSTRLQDLTLGEILNGSSKVIALYNSEKFEPQLDEDFDTYRHVWPFGTYIDDMYKGCQSATEMENYLASVLPNTANTDKITKMQYILAWDIKADKDEILNDFRVGLSSSLASMEDDLPSRFPAFYTAEVADRGRRVNVIFVDFYERMYSYVMKEVFERNGNTNLMVGDGVKGSNTSLVVGQTYQLLAHRTLDDNQRYSLCGFADDVDQYLRIESAKPGFEPALFMLVPHPTQTGFRLYHVESGTFVARKDTSNGPFTLVKPGDATGKDTSLTFSAHDAAKGIMYIKSSDGHLKCGGFENTDDGPWNATCPVEETGDTGSNERWQFHPANEPMRILGSSDDYQIYDGGTYMVICGEGDNGMVLSFVGDDHNPEPVLEDPNVEQTRQHWQVHMTSSGIALKNIGTGAYLGYRTPLTVGQQLIAVSEITGNSTYLVHPNDAGIYLWCQSVVEDSRYVHDDGENGEAGDKIVVWHHSGSDAQQWFFKKPQEIVGAD